MSSIEEEIRGEPIARGDLRVGDIVDFWEGDVLNREGWIVKGEEYWGPWSDYGLDEEAHFRLIDRPASRPLPPTIVSGSGLLAAARALKSTPGITLNSQECVGAMVEAFRAAGITVEGEGA